MNKRVIWSGCPLDGSGYGKVARDYIYWLNESKKVDLDCNIVTYTNINPSQYLTDDQIEYFRKLNNPNLRMDTDTDLIFINHITPDIAFSVDKYKINSLYSVWETSNIPLTATERCNSFDFIMTASEYSKQAFINGGVNVPIEVVPHIVTPVSLVENEKLEELTKDKFVFLSIFEWHLGKGYDTLIKGFIEAFRDNPDVLLILKVNSFVNPFYLKEEVINYVREQKGGLKYPQIIPICNPVHEDVLNSLYKYADVYVSCSRREGFSLTLAQAMVNGLPIIAADKGGHRQFLNTENSFLIPSKFENIKLLEKERRNYSGQQWIEMDYNEFVNTLIGLYKTSETEDWLSNEVAIDEEAQKVIKQLSPDIIINKFLELFNKYYR